MHVFIRFFEIGFALVSLVNLLDLWPDRESLFTDAAC